MKGIRLQRALLLSSAAFLLITSAQGLQAQCPNPIDDASFFVRQQYRDFLNREPTTSELRTGVNQINACGGNASCVAFQRVLISRAFWDNAEFRAQSRTFGLSIFGPPHLYDNRDFIFLSYNIYLRRDPDDPPDFNLDGFNFWLNDLNTCTGPEDGGDRDTDPCYNHIVEAFLLSIEYRSRFGCA
jgi:hypothetical protein